MTSRAAVYVRQSLDRTGEGLAVARQERACRAKAAALSWPVVQVFTDNDVSASTGRLRPAYRAMLDAIEAGTVDAVVVWDLDRLTRRPIETEEFIELADRHGVALASVGGDVDLSTDNGRLYARIKGAVARAEVERKGARQRDANDQRAAAGRPHGGRRAFGYTTAGDVVEAEAVHYRRTVAAFLAGGSIRSLTADLNARGATTTTGGPWRTTEVRRLLANPRHAGLRVHRGEVVGQGVWTALVSTDDHLAVLALLADPSRRAAGRPRSYLLSGVATCSLCGARLYGRQERRGPVYVCEAAAHLVRRAQDIEALVEDVVVARLGLPDAAQVLASPDTVDAVTGLRQERATLVGRLSELSLAFTEGAIDRAQLTVGSARLRERIEEVDARMPVSSGAPALSVLVAADDVRAVWDALDVEARRDVVRVLLEVVVAPAGRGARRFDPSTVVLRWR